MTILSDVRSHASRILNWRLNEVVPTSREHKHMDAAGVSDNPIFRSFLAWRHTNLTLAFPITLFSAIWGLLTLPSFLADNDYMANFTLFGKILLAVPYYANTLLFLSVCVSAIWWNNWRRTRFLLKIGWAASFGVSFVPALFPLEYVLSSDTLTTLIDPSNNINFFLLKMRWAMKYLFVLLPLVVSFPSGAMRAAIRIRGLLPQSALTCWIMVISAPFYSILILTSLVVLIQVVGNVLLIVGSLLLTLNPWGFVMFRRYYIRSYCDAHEQRLNRIQQLTGIVNALGLIFIVVWATTSGTVGNVFGWQDVVRFAVVGFGNGLVVSIVFCDSFLRMTVTHWAREHERYLFEGKAGHIADMALHKALEGSIRKPKYELEGDDDDDDDKRKKNDTGIGSKVDVKGGIDSQLSSSQFDCERDDSA